MTNLTGAQTAQASGNIADCSFIKQDPAADFCALQAGAGDTPIGVTLRGSEAFPSSTDTGTRYLATAGNPVPYFAAGARTLLRAGTGGWVRGNKLKPDANGNGVAAGSGDAFGAEAEETVAAGELGEVIVKFGSAP